MKPTSASSRDDAYRRASKRTAPEPPRKRSTMLGRTRTALPHRHAPARWRRPRGARTRLKTPPNLPVAVITAPAAPKTPSQRSRRALSTTLRNLFRSKQLRTLVRSALKLSRPSANAATTGAREKAMPMWPPVGASRPHRRGGGHAGDARADDRLARSQARYTSPANRQRQGAPARLIHLKGSRQAGPFVAVNFGAIPER